jgi:predicted P-loop ATPase
VTQTPNIATSPVASTISITTADDLFDQETVGREITGPWAAFAERLTVHARRASKDAGGDEALCYTLARFRDAPCTCRQAPVRRPDGSWTVGCPDYDHAPGRRYRGHRIARNVIAVTALGIDFDKDESNRPLTPDAVDRVLEAFVAKGIRAVIYTTHSHTAQRPSYRLCVALSREVPGHEWDRFLPVALAQVDIPAGCHADARHVWFFPSAPDGADVGGVALDGSPLDVDAILASASPVVGRVRVGAVHLPDEDDEPEWLATVSQEQRVTDMRAQLTRELGEVHPAHAGPDTDDRRVRNGLTWTIACTVSRVYGVRDPDDVLDAMLAIYNSKCVPPYDEDKVASIVRQAFAEGEKTWGDYYSPEQVAERAQQIADASDPAFVKLFADLVPKRPPVAPSGVFAAAPAASATDVQVLDAPVIPGPSVTEVELTLRNFARRRGHRFDDEVMDAEYLSRMYALGEELVGGKRTRRRCAEIFVTNEDVGRAAVAVVRRAPRDAAEQTLAAILSGHIQNGLVSDLQEFVREAREAAWQERRQRESENLTLDENEFRMDKGRPVSTAEHNIRVGLRKLGVTLYHNKLADQQEVDSGEGREYLEDHHLKTLHNRLERAHDFVPPKEKLFDTAEVIARENAYHPVLDYLDSLPVWDGVPRVETWLIDHAGVKDTPYVRAVSRLILVAAVRRVRRPGCKFDEMLILESDTQGFYKSTMVKALAVNEDWYSPKLYLDGDDRRWMEQTAGRWICEAGELSKMSKTQSNELKAQLSAEVDRTRKAYGRLPTTRPRQFVIIGTTNEREYLVDSTGNRRYWPVQVTRPIDIKAFRTIVSQLWAEAAQLEQLNADDDEYIRLDPSLYGAAAVEQEERRTKNPIEILLEERLSDKKGKIRLSDTWLLAELEMVNRKRPSLAESKEIDAAMTRLGWTKPERAIRFSNGESRAWIKGNEEECLTELSVDTQGKLQTRTPSRTSNRYT